jgi:hypothetical protein
MAAIGALAAATLVTDTSVIAAQSVQANLQRPPQKKKPKAVEMVPLLAVSRVTSPDRTFIECATESAISTMTKSQAEIAAARLSSIQSEAVRAFNTAADAYNSLADIASERRIKIATPTSFFEEERSPNPIDGAPVEPADVAYLTTRESALSGTIGMYANDVRDGRDPKVVAFARQMKSRLEHDLLLATVALQNLNSGDYGDRSGATSDASGASTVSDRP